MRRSGQASIEYVGAILVVAVAMVTLAVASVSTGLAAAVASAIETGICIAGGDICRSADAAAKRLEPCAVSARGAEKATAFGAFVLRTRHGHAYVVEQRSDGRVLVQSTDDRDIGVGVDAGIRLGPVADVGAGAGHKVRFHTGRAWLLDDMAAARRLLAMVPNAYELADDGDSGFYDVPRAPIRYTARGGVSDLALSVHVGSDEAETSFSGLSGEARDLLGTREAPEGRTRYVQFDSSTSGLLSDLIPGMGRGGTWTAEFHDARPPAVTVRRVVAGSRPGESVETVAHAVLRSDDDITAGRLFVLFRLQPPAALLLARRLARQVEAGGHVERRVYAEERDDGGFAVSVLGAGLEHSTSSFRRRLVSATVVGGGAAGAARRDCLPSR